MTADAGAAEHDRRVTIPARFCGPPGTGNGGYVAGRLAAFFGATDTVQVTLREPPPLDTPLDIAVVEDGAARVVATFGGAVVAEAQRANLKVDPSPPVDFATATELMRQFAGLAHHPFPTCFVCGTDRTAPDGLALRPGRLPDRPDTVVTAWVPHPSLGDDGQLPRAIVWAALDCPGGWSADLVGRPMVLGRMTAAVDAVPDVGERCVVLGRLRGKDGRKTFTTTTAYDGDGRIFGRAEAVWFDVDPARFGGR